MKKTIKEITERIKVIKWELEDISHPEEKYENACKEYHDARMKANDRTINILMRLDDLNAKLTKPLTEYSRSKYHPFNYQHPVAKEIDGLQRELKNENWWINNRKEEMIKRKDTLENFNGIKSKLEMELNALADNLKEYQKLMDAKEAKKRPKKESVCDYKIRMTDGFDGMPFTSLDLEDLRTISNNGIKDLNFIVGKDLLYMTKTTLRAILKNLPPDSIAYAKDGKLNFKWDSGYLSWKGTGTIAELIVDTAKHECRLIH